MAKIPRGHGVRPEASARGGGTVVPVGRLTPALLVGPAAEGRLVVYQGVPWNAVGVDLYREIYVSRLLAAQLSPEGRAQLFDHSLVSEDVARAQGVAYEREATP